MTGAFLILFMAYGTQYAFGVFFAALIDEFGWSRASLSGVFSLYAFTYAAFALVSGRLTDRWGPRAVIAIGGVLLGLGLIAMSRVSALWQPYVCYGLVAALGMSTAYVPCNATVAKWFTRRRGLAIGLASAGGSLGTFALPPVAHLVVSRLGWRWAYVVFGVAVLLALNALAVLMRRDPETIGLHPDGDARPRSATAPPEAVDGAAGRCGPARSGCSSRCSARRGSRCSSRSCTWCRWPAGSASRRCWPRRSSARSAPPRWSAACSWEARRIGSGGGPALAVALALQAAAFVGFALARELPALYAASLLFGFSYGAGSTLFPAAVADYFGREQAASLAGLLFALAGSMAAWGPLAAGFIYDRAGSYQLAWWLGAGFNALALILLAVARPPASRSLA